jgi:hypothetical protein
MAVRTPGGTLPRAVQTSTNEIARAGKGETAGGSHPK